jgi:hypothetical protein
MRLTLTRIFFGVDMALGFLNYAAWSWLAGHQFSVWFLLLSIFATHLPDADMIPYLLLRRRYQLVSHWVVGHHPPLVLGTVAIVSFWAASTWLPNLAVYITCLVTSGVLLHFLHDGMSRLGFPWLSPFSAKFFRFQRGKLEIVPQTEIDEWTNYWRTHPRSAAEEISTRAEPIDFKLLLFWVIAFLCLLIFALNKGAILQR